MDAGSVIAVMGACGPERNRHARRLAAQTGRAFVSAVPLRSTPRPAHAAQALLSTWKAHTDVVIEFPEDASALDVIGAFSAPSSERRLDGLTCVVDAAHIIDDLYRADNLPPWPSPASDSSPSIARASRTVEQIEYASTLVVVNTDPVPTADLSVITALLNHLSPRARLHLRPELTDAATAPSTYASEQERAGWLSVLNGAFAPHMTDPTVSALRYEQVRPLHPGRLLRLLDRIEQETFGRLVRSAGFCRFATRPDTIAQWDHVGRVISFHPLGADDRIAADDELLAVGQDIVLFGIGLREEQLVEALDAAALTDAELLAGPEAWSAIADPFPLWATAPEHRE